MLEILQQSGGLTEVFGQIWFFIVHGGWVILVATAAYMLYILYLDEIQGQFLDSQQWVFLNIRIPRKNEQSTLAVEQIFTQMHALSTTLTFAHKYVEGKLQLWYSLEMVSLGGKISYIIRSPKKVKDLVEASLYAQYPDAEITEVEDYMTNIEYQDGEEEGSNFDVWGCEFRLTDDTAMPIKTYREFEHPTAEKKIVDPLKSLFEALDKMQPYEMYSIQLLIRPINDDDWKPIGEKKAREIVEGEKKKKQPFSLISFLAKFILPAGEEKAEDKKDKNFSMLSDMEKERVNGVLRKISKPGYLTKMRHIYIAPKDRFDGTKKSLVIGAYRTLGTGNTNRFKPDTKRTWVGLEYKVSATLEQPYIDKVLAYRKHLIFKAFKARSFGIGLPPFILNVEELATIYHLPLIGEDATALPAIEAVESKKAQPPANLPIGDY